MWKNLKFAYKSCVMQNRLKLTVVMDFATADTVISCNETGYPGFVSGRTSFLLHLQTGIDFGVGIGSIGIPRISTMMSGFVIRHFDTKFTNLVTSLPLQNPMKFFPNVSS